jgi:hypothetical protein
MLSKRERVMRTTQFKETDRVPIYDLLQNDAVIEHYAAEVLQSEPLNPANGAKAKGFTIGRIFDMTRAPEGPSEPGLLRQENGIVVHIEPWTSWIVERPFKEVPEMVEWVKAEIKRSNAQVSNDATGEQFHQWLDSCAALFAAGDPTGRGDPTVQVIESGVGLTEMYWQLGWENFTTLMFDYSALLEEWLEARLCAELRRVEAIADPQRIPIVLTYDDIAYKNTTLISPKWLRKYWVPRLTRLVNAWHNRDTLCLFHSDGNLWPVLDDLVGAGIDGLNPLEVMAGMSVKEVRRRYPHLFLTGGIDVSQLLPLGTPAEIREVCKQTIADAGNTGYFLGSTTELHWTVPLENAIAMFEAVQP